jgi:hypothetical protein
MTYYFMVQTVTYPHDLNNTTVRGEYDEEANRSHDIKPCLPTKKLKREKESPKETNEDKRMNLIELHQEVLWSKAPGIYSDCIFKRDLFVFKITRNNV